MSNQITQPHRAPMQFGHLLGLAVFLLSMTGAGAAIVYWQTHGSSLLGFSKAPGDAIITALGLLGAWQYATFGRASAGHILATTVMLLIPLLPSFVSNLHPLILPPVHPMVLVLGPLIPRTLGVLTACGCVCIAGCVVYDMKGSVFAKGAYFLVGAYVDSVYIWNAYLPEQYTDFFGQGWTV